MTYCELCPRRCGVNRSVAVGACGAGNNIKVARAALHMWEEPCISGSRGSGTVFFSGCPLGCVFCQNADISHRASGATITTTRLGEIFLELQEQGAHNINLVSPTQYIPQIVEALRITEHRRTIPVVYNTGGYELVDSLRLLEGLVDIYLPDLKYMDSERALLYSNASDYPVHATAAIDEMVRQVGECRTNSEGLMTQGTLVRHLVLPAGCEDSKAVIRYLHGRYGNTVWCSLMSQYTPQHYNGELRELRRPLSSLEYNRITDLAAELDVQGFLQQRDSARVEYTPSFDLTGVHRKTQN